MGEVGDENTTFGRQLRDHYRRESPTAGMDELNANGVRVSVYIAAAMVCIAAGGASSRAQQREPRLISAWLALGNLMLVLGLARVIDFGPWATAVGGQHAQLEGWYDERREIQFWSVWGAIGATAIAAGLAILATPRQARAALPATLVAACLVGFVVIRAISFHDIDALLYRDAYRGILLNTACELGLSLAFTVAALWGATRSLGGQPRHSRSTE